MLPDWDFDPINWPVKVTVLFAIPRSRTSALMVPMGDVDNFEKALYDLLQRKKYLSDDKFIVTTAVKKRFLPFGKEGYSEIVLEEETDDIDIEGD